MQVWIEWYNIKLCISIIGAIQFARSEGLIPAPEPTHAIAATIREALHCRETGEAKVILTAMCGHGHFDLPAYEKYLQGNMVDLSFSEDKLKASLANISQVTSWVGPHSNTKREKSHQQSFYGVLCKNVDEFDKIILV